MSAAGYSCPEAIGGHGSATRDGCCPYCGRRIAPAWRPPIRAHPNADLEDVIDPLTLEPRDPAERDEPPRHRTRRRTA